MTVGKLASRTLHYIYGLSIASSLIFSPAFFLSQESCIYFGNTLESLNNITLNTELALYHLNVPFAIGDDFPRADSEFFHHSRQTSLDICHMHIQQYFPLKNEQLYGKLLVFLLGSLALIAPSLLQ